MVGSPGALLGKINTWASAYTWDQEGAGCPAGGAAVPGGSMSGYGRWEQSQHGKEGIQG